MPKLCRHPTRPGACDGPLSVYPRCLSTNETNGMTCRLPSHAACARLNARLTRWRRARRKSREVMEGKRYGPNAFPRTPARSDAQPFACERGLEVNLLPGREYVLNPVTAHILQFRNALNCGRLCACSISSCPPCTSCSSSGTSPDILNASLKWFIFSLKLVHGSSSVPGCGWPGVSGRLYVARSVIRSEPQERLESYEAQKGGSVPQEIANTAAQIYYAVHASNTRP